MVYCHTNKLIKHTNYEVKQAKSSSLMPQKRDKENPLVDRVGQVIFNYPRIYIHLMDNNRDLACVGG